MKLAFSLSLFYAFILQGSAFQVQSFRIEDLLHPAPSTLERIRRAVTEHGMIAVLQEGREAEHKAAMRELVQCIHSGAAGSYAHETELKDQTIRTTLATSTNASHSMPFDEELLQRCPEFVRASDSVRAAAALTGQAYAQLLDQLEHGSPLLNLATSPFQDAVARAENLEHFHVYWRREERQPQAEPTLSMHTDLGMFIVMTPPQYYEFTTSTTADAVDSGFQMRLPNGEIVTPEFPAGSLVVMNGEGCADWIQSRAAQMMYVPPHQVVVPDKMLGLGRAWYGRMYLPPRDSHKNDQKSMTFHQYWSEASTAMVRSSVGELRVDHRMLLEQGNCSAGYLYCWMKCMATTNVSSCNAANIDCKDPSSGQRWPYDTQHCYGCTLVCNATTTTTTTTSSSLVLRPMLWAAAAVLSSLAFALV